MRGNRLVFRTAGVGICSTFLVLSGCAKITSRNTPATARKKGDVATLLVVTPERLDFGTLTQGSNSELEITLENRGPGPVIITTIKSSCECFRVKLLTDYFEPAGKVTATAILDLSSDPKFTGKLELEITGFTKPSYAVAFALKADVRVIPKP